MPESYPRHMAHAAPEDELIRLEEAYAEIEERRRRTPPTESMRRIPVRQRPHDDVTLHTGDLDGDH